MVGFRCARPLRRLLLASLPVMALLPLLAAQPAAAAPDSAPAGAAAPASPAEMNLYTRIAAVNVCIARSAGIDYDKAVAVAGETIAQLIQGQHGGRIAQVGSNPLSADELRKGSINSAVLGSVEVCPNEVPAEVKSKVEAVIKSAAGQAPAGQQPAGQAPAGKSAAPASKAPAPAAKP